MTITPNIHDQFSEDSSVGWGRRRRGTLAVCLAAVMAVGAIAFVPADAMASESDTHVGDVDAADQGFGTEEYDDAMQRLRDRHPWAFDNDETPIAGHAIALNWAAELGRVMFKNVAGLGFDAYLDALFGPNRPGRPLGEIADSLTTIKNQVTEIENAIRALQESADRNAFIAAEGWAKTYARDIQSQVKLIDGWQSGHAHTAADVQDAVNVTYRAIEQLEVHLLGPLGSQTMLAALLRHGDRSAAHEQLDTYREGYRSSLATGLLSLEWAATYDAKHLNQLNHARATANPTAEKLYDIGKVSSSMHPSWGSRLTTSNGQVVPLNTIIGQQPGQPWRGVEFTVSDTLPTTMSKWGNFKLGYGTTSSYYWTDIDTLELEIDHYSGAVKGTASGRISHRTERTNSNWSWQTNSVTGTIAHQGNGWLVIDIPIQNVTGSGSSPFSNIHLVMYAD